MEHTGVGIHRVCGVGSLSLLEAAGAVSHWPVDSAQPLITACLSLERFALDLIEKSR